jgi:RNA polymerase sigma-70 factor, ECF subfamily
VAPPALSLVRLLSSCLNSNADDLWQELVRRVQPVIALAIVRTFYRYSHRRPDSDVVEDLVQQTYLRLCADNYGILRKFEKQDDPAFLAYIRTMATNAAIDRLRSGSRTFEPLDPEMSGQAKDTLLEGALLSAIDKHVKICAGREAGRDRRIFWLHYRLGFTASEIARMPQFGLSPKGAETLLLRLTRCVRQAMAEGIRASGSFLQGGSSVGAAT